MSAATESIEIIETRTCPEGMVSVKVYREISPIPEGMRWFTASIKGLIELEFIYYVPEIDGFASQPHVQAIHKLHPDHVLVYL
jgi:hypothetical protein